MKLDRLFDKLGLKNKKENDLNKMTYRTTKIEASRVDFYYSNLINSLVLFAASPEYLESLAGPVFNPISELETELDYAFIPVLFDEIFEKHLLPDSLKLDLLDFKLIVDKTPNGIWTWEHICESTEWQDLRNQANNLLDRIGIKNKVYNEDFTKIYDSNGNIVKDSNFEIK
jgi:hypothetical protein